MKRAKKILNDPREVVSELLDGLLAAEGNMLKRVGDYQAVARTSIPDGKVAVLIGGGSGHEPMFPGFVGENLADGAACGNVFAAPDPETILAATRAVDRGNGVLYLYGNYAGDNMNFDMAAELAEEEGIQVRTVRVTDDIATPQIAERRGIAGDVCVIKIAGAASSQAGMTLDRLHDVTAKARDNTRSLAVAVSAGSTPESGEPTFEIGDDEIEIGMGAHGEPGVSREKMQRSEELVTKMTGRLIDDLPFTRGDKVVVIVNNLGSTTMMELLIANRSLHKRLADSGIDVHDTLVGSFITTQEMAGFSVTLMKLDEELQRYHDMACRSFALTSEGHA